MRQILLFSFIFLVSACSTVEPTKRPEPSVSPSQELPKRTTPTEKATYPKMKPNAHLAPNPDIKADPYAKPANKTIPVYSMKKSHITGVSDAYRSLNMSDNVPTFKKIPPKGRDVVLDTVERTGGNRMNASDPTTNRRVYRQR